MPRDSPRSKSDWSKSHRGRYDDDDMDRSKKNETSIRQRDHSRPRHEESSYRRRRSRSGSSDDRGTKARRHHRDSTGSRSSPDSPPVTSKITAKLTREEETPTQKRERRLAKKLAKEKRRRERASSVEMDIDNRFGDSEIHKPFVWSKKLQKDGGLEHLTPEQLKRRNKQKQEEARAEIEKVRERTKQYERERAAREEELHLVQREKESAQFQMWEAQEDVFHLKQAQLRSEIRIRDGRAKPVDLLAKYISSQLDDLSIDIHEPYTYVEGLGKKDLEDLLEDIGTYQKLEEDKNVQYWNDITIIVNEELSKILRNEAEMERRAGRQGINSSVSSDVNSVFRGKTLTQLVELEKQIHGKISGRTEGVDVSYWETLLQQVRAYMARVRLREKHQENLKLKLEELKKEQGIRDEERLLMPPPRESTSTVELLPTQMYQSEEEQQHILEYSNGQYSPTRISFDDMDVHIHLVEPEEDTRKLQMARDQVMKTGSAAIVTTEDHVFERESRKGMGEDEAQFSVESVLEQPVTWSEKYRPRKPRYFNRVHTGFEWNKYNQTHYDLDNPPPKVVQGYKFNIFYPDLIEKSKTPTYKIFPCEDNTDFGVLRISAGAPYEDIAFKVVNREWEYSYKRGFRCQFHNNIFQLWFHFKRYRYRR